MVVTVCVPCMPTLFGRVPMTLLPVRSPPATIWLATLFTTPAFNVMLPPEVMVPGSLWVTTVRVTCWVPS
ncbi:hypothetical protein GO279_04894 [Ralstonia solanacearum]|nr:hypothetical protein [Ralstonia solanacearum]NKA86378.1 hypothetical protein [Ralstonia solanacearum]NKF57794.1 hypothetical protein [Ralstonia solanacearum]NKF62726.1 hypothetical protein [Ralstonia solanacearum]NKF67699.1 hypothetical protein [Ralstonia solanacearum]